jgi:hypothetical protein
LGFGNGGSEVGMQWELVASAKERHGAAAETGFFREDGNATPAGHKSYDLLGEKTSDKIAI